MKNSNQSRGIKRPRLFLCGLSVDPVDDCTFWYTQEDYAATSDRGWQIRIGSFRLPGCIHDLAVVKITAKATVTRANPVMAGVTVQIQNRSDHPESIDLSDLGNGVTTGLVRLSVTTVDDDGERCQLTPPVLDNATNSALFSGGPLLLASKQLLTVSYLVTYNCASPQVLNKSDATRGDYEHVATVYHDVLDGSLDDHAADDSCPHAALPGNLDSNPPPKGVKDKGCGAKKPGGTVGAPVQTDVIQ